MNIFSICLLNFCECEVVSELGVGVRKKLSFFVAVFLLRKKKRKKRKLGQNFCPRRKKKQKGKKQFFFGFPLFFFFSRVHKTIFFLKILHRTKNKQKKT